jgi:hypothetical protein
MSQVKEEMTRIVQEQPEDSSFDEILRELAFARNDSTWSSRRRVRSDCQR